MSEQETMSRWRLLAGIIFVLVCGVLIRRFLAPGLIRDYRMEGIAVAVVLLFAIFHIWSSHKDWRLGRTNPRSEGQCSGGHLLSDNRFRDCRY